MRYFTAGVLILFSCFSAANEQHIETLEVEGRQINLIGEAVSASEGVVGQQEIQLRPLLRTGEVLELVPGMVVTQHSGTGKANQYFLRGFNLDHGTDFSTFVDGMPVNMRTHGHGQGYTDLNFLIPEAVGQLTYKKGAYYVDVGDFSSAGNASFSTANQLDKGMIELALGEDDYARFLFLDSYRVDNADTLVAFELNRYDGPWSDISEDLDKKNLLIKYTMPMNEGHLSFSFMAYDNQWNSADQIPGRAVTQGLIDDLGSIDKTVGGESSRNSFSVQWGAPGWQASAYLINYDLNLWSNFTYFLEDPINGDQFEQVDERLIYGGSIIHEFDDEWFGRSVTNRFGVDARVDDIDEVGLYRTRARQRLGVIRSDEVDQQSVGVFWQSSIAWTDRLRSVLGARFDHFNFDVDDRVGVNINDVDLSVNGGTESDDIFSLKGSVIYLLNSEWELYAAAGQGFHSNDARGTTTDIDPADGTQVNAVDPLVRSFGVESGIRGFISDRINASLSLWTLKLESELLFVGDAGNTEASRESKRQGIELTTYYRLTEEWSLDLEYAYTDAEFTESAPEGDKIPGAIEQVIQAGLNAELDNGWFGSLRVRYFGERPLIEDGSIVSDSSTIWNLRAGYQTKQWVFKVDLLNLTDSDDHDIDYYYESQLTSEPVAIEDIHYHIFEPRTLRISVSYTL